MKIAVFEHFTALPRAAPVADRSREGRAMRDAVVTDLARLPGSGVLVVERRRDLRAALRWMASAEEAISLSIPIRHRPISKTQNPGEELPI